MAPFMAINAWRESSRQSQLRHWKGQTVGFTRLSFALEGNSAYDLHDGERGGGGQTSGASLEASAKTNIFIPTENGTPVFFKMFVLGVSLQTWLREVLNRISAREPVIRSEVFLCFSVIPAGKFRILPPPPLSFHILTIYHLPVFILSDTINF
jgi:hypothetical protein